MIFCICLLSLGAVIIKKVKEIEQAEGVDENLFFSQAFRLFDCFSLLYDSCRVIARNVIFLS